MLFKKIVAGFLAACLAAAPVAVFSEAANNDVQVGGWEDGTKMLWLCHPKANGSVLFEVHMPEGRVYRGTLSCGEPI